MVQHNGWIFEEFGSQRGLCVAQQFSATALRSLPLSCCQSVVFNVLERFSTVQHFFVVGTLRESEHFEDKNWPSAAPSGYYRVSITFGNIWTITYDNEVVSDIKTSF